MKRVVLIDDKKDRGYSILLHSGTVVYTDEVDTYIVSHESVEKLKESGIKFIEKPIN